MILVYIFYFPIGVGGMGGALFNEISGNVREIFGKSNLFPGKADNGSALTGQWGSQVIE